MINILVSVNKEKDKTLLKTVANISKTESSNDISKFTGTINIYDSFATRMPLLLNVKIEKQDCEQTKKSFVLFRFSPKGLDNTILYALENI